jgi:putative hydrolase of the HAD superfamily
MRCACSAVLDIAAVFLDLDNTLWNIEPVIARANEVLNRFLQERCPRVPPLDAQEGWRSRFAAVIAANAHMQHDFTFIRKEALRQCVREAGYPLTFADDAFDVFFRARNEVELYVDVIPALERLVRKYRLVAVSNGNADLDAIGLASFFEHRIAARDVGALKPEPAVFKAALARVELDPHQVVHVGDEPSADIEGARRAGLHAIWINRHNAIWPEELEPPKMTAATLSEVADKLGV